jgi:dienelactone hydrolase
MTNIQKAYFGVPGEGEHFNVDVYQPSNPASKRSNPRSPAVIVVAGGGGKSSRPGEAVPGAYLASYHDIAACLADAGFWVFVPSRRGDPCRTPLEQDSLSESLRRRVPSALFAEPGANEGTHSHLRQLAELKAVISRLEDYRGAGLDVERVGLFGKSAGGAVALRLASEMPQLIGSVALWGAALKTSQWFKGPRADEFFRTILDARGIRYDRLQFLNEICDAVDYVAGAQAPLLFGCGTGDPYATPAVAPDTYTNADEQLVMLHYAVHSRRSRVMVVKGAEHTIWRESAAWVPYASSICDWFVETL